MEPIDNSKQINANNTVILAKEQFWNEHITLQKDSDLSIAAYCRKHELNCDQFYHWRRRNLPSTPKLLSVKLQTTKNTSNLETLCSLTLRNGIVLKIHDPEVLFSLITKLGE